MAKRSSKYVLFKDDGGRGGGGGGAKSRLIQNKLTKHMRRDGQRHVQEF